MLDFAADGNRKKELRPNIDAGRSRFVEIRTKQAKLDHEYGEILCRECKDIGQAIGIPTTTTASREA
jgi:hypothetical protein